MDDVLRRAPLFAALDDEQAAELRASMSEVTLARGDALFHEGDPGDRLYVVTEGKVKLHRTSPDGRENMLAVLGPGELIGELSLFDPGPRTATATALTEVKLLGLGHGDLQPWLNARPEVATALLRAVARRLRKTNDQMSDLVFSDVPGPCRPRAPRPVAPLRRAVGGGHPRRPRPDAGGAGPARRRLPRDREQGAGRLRAARLAAPGGPRRDPAGRGAPREAFALAPSASRVTRTAVRPSRSATHAHAATKGPPGSSPDGPFAYARTDVQRLCRPRSAGFRCRRRTARRTPGSSPPPP